MKNLILTFLFILLFIISVTGKDETLVPYIELQNMSYIQAIGIDIDPDNPNQIIGTFISSFPESSSKEGGSTSTNVISLKGTDMSDLFFKLFETSDRRPTLTFVSTILFGDNIAKKDMLKYIDFIFRFYQFRNNIHIMVVKDKYAQDFLNTTNNSGYTAIKRLTTLVSTSTKNSKSYEIDLSDIIDEFNNPYIAQILPTVEIVNNNLIPSGTKTNIAHWNDIKFSGLAVFKNSKFIGYMNETETLGFNIIKNKAKTTLINIVDKNNDNISVEVEFSEAKFETNLSDDNYKVKIKVNCLNKIMEYSGDKKITEKEFLNDLNNKVKDEIIKILNSSILFSKKNNSDILNISSLIHIKNPDKWNKYKDKWNDIFPKIEYDLDIESKIYSTYDTLNPYGEMRGEN